MSRPFRAMTIAGKPTQGDALGWYAWPLQGREVGVDIYFGPIVSILPDDSKTDAGTRCDVIYEGTLLEIMPNDLGEIRPSFFEDCCNRYAL